MQTTIQLVWAKLVVGKVIMNIFKPGINGPQVRLGPRFLNFLSGSGPIPDLTILLDSGPASTRDLDFINFLIRVQSKINHFFLSLFWSVDPGFKHVQLDKTTASPTWKSTGWPAVTCNTVSDAAVLLTPFLNHNHVTKDPLQL